MSNEMKIEKSSNVAKNPVEGMMGQIISQCGCSKYSPAAIRPCIPTPMSTKYSYLRGKGLSYMKASNTNLTEIT